MDFIFLCLYLIFKQNLSAMSTLRKFIILLLVIFNGLLYAQFNKPVDIFYEGVTLSSFLSDIEIKHQVNFSYSKDKLNLNKKISTRIKEKNITDALCKIFDANQIAYSIVGKTWVLKQSASNTKSPVWTVVNKNNVNQQTAEIVSRDKTPLLNIETPKDITKTENQFVESDIKKVTIQYNYFGFYKRLKANIQKSLKSWEKRKYSSDFKFLKFSLFGEKMPESNQTNVISLSLGWGVHGSSEAFQLAGIGNKVRRNVNGLQIGGVFNTSSNVLNGVQISSAYNYADRVNGSQFSLGINNANSKLNGIQTSFVANYTGFANKSTQLSGLSNISMKGNSNLQISSLLNIAEDLNGSQLSLGYNQSEALNGVQIGSINKAKTVRGLQLGFINIADSVKGASLGLINIVKNGGYNKLEAAFSESVNVQFSLKLGARSLYQIYHAGFGLRGKAWGVGLGLGSVMKCSKKWNFNVEASIMHVNEDVKWKSILNLMNTMRFGFEYNLESGFGIFLGPSVNFMISQNKSIETGIIGSNVPMYSFFDYTKNNTNYSVWIGFHSGLRMTIW